MLSKSREKITAKIIVLILLVSWVLIGEPVIWNNPRIPPELRKTSAASPETFTSSGTFNAPTGIYAVTIECWGAGGAGGGFTTNGRYYKGGGGAGGQYVIDNIYNVTPTTGYSVNIGVGGTCPVGGNGGVGGDSTFNINGVVAKGGAGGQSYESGYQPGLGSTSGAVGDTFYRGGNGSAGGSSSTGGSGGGGAGSGGNGGDASGNTAGTGTSVGGGSGGAGITSGASAGNPGSVYGGGGGAGASLSAPNKTDFEGGSGADGRCIITYTDIWAPSTNETSYSNTWTFASAPSNDSAVQISMTATTGYDYTTPIQYLFTLDNSGCTAGHSGSNGTSSSWQNNVAYSDTGLDANKCYGYTVKARDSMGTPNTGPASSISYTYTSANTPGTPSLSNPGLYTLDLDSDANSNPSSNPTTYFAAQVTYTNPTDSTWENQWIDSNGDPSGAEVWLTDAQLDAITLDGLNTGTTYGVSIKARNQDNDETYLSSEGRGTTISPIISVTLTTSGSIAYGLVPPSTPTSTLDLDPVATQTVRNNGNVTEDFLIASTDAEDIDGVDWVLGTTLGFAYKFSTNSGSSWTNFDLADDYKSLVEDLIVDGTQSFDLEITVPIDPGDTGEKTIITTVMAVEAN